MIIIHLIYIFDLVMFIYYINILVTLLLKKTTDIFYYKIYNKIISIIIVFSYISIFIILLFIYRLKNMDRFLDLKEIYPYFLNYLTIEIPLIFKVYNICCLLSIIFIMLLSLINIHKYSCLEIYKWYIFINYNHFLRNNKSTKKFYELFSKISVDNLISYLINFFAYNITIFFEEMEKKHDVICDDEFALHKKIDEFTLKIYKITNHRFLNIKKVYSMDVFIFIGIPIFLIVYDCIFNDFLLTHLFYYLPFCTAIILLQKITKTIGLSDQNIHNLLWEIYYQKETCIYCYTSDQKLLLEYFISNGLKLPLSLPGDLSRVFLSQQLYMLRNTPLRFYFLENSSTYVNSEGLVIKEESPGIFFSSNEKLYLYLLYKKNNDIQHNT